VAAAIVESYLMNTIRVNNSKVVVEGCAWKKARETIRMTQLDTETKFLQWNFVEIGSIPSLRYINVRKAIKTSFFSDLLEFGGMVGSGGC
jgi:hypothetical protein